MSYIVVGRRGDRRASASGHARHPRVDDVSGHDRGIRAAAARSDAACKAGVDFFLAFSPERVDPGNPKFNTHNVPKVVGGIDPDSTRSPARSTASAIDTIVPVSSPQVAEMVKLLENTFRAVNIGLVNEIALMCDRLGSTSGKSCDAAKTKPFGFMPFYPGPGSAATASRSIRSICRGKRSRAASSRGSSSSRDRSTARCRTSSSTRLPTR